MILESTIFSKEYLFEHRFANWSPQNCYISRKSLRHVNLFLGELLPSFTMGKIHKFFFEFLVEIFLVFWRVKNDIRKYNIF